MTVVAEQSVNGRRPPEPVPVENGELAGTAEAPIHRATGMDLAQLRRVQWAVRATLTLGVAASVCANVLHARDELISQAIAAWPPLALLLTVELVSRVPVYRRSLATVRILATAAIAGIAAYVSYWHMAAVAARYGENGVAPYLLPLSVDGLIVVASVSLVELAGRVRTARAEHHPETTTAPATGRGSAVAARASTNSRLSGGPGMVPGDRVPENDMPEGRQTDSIPTTMAETQMHPTPTNLPQSDPLSDPANGRDKTAVGADIVMLLPAARAAQETLRRQGRSLSRDALAAQLRADGHTIATGKVSALLSLLRMDASADRANGTHPAAPSSESR